MIGTVLKVAGIAVAGLGVGYVAGTWGAGEIVEERNKAKKEAKKLRTEKESLAVMKTQAELRAARWKEHAEHQLEANTRLQAALEELTKSVNQIATALV